MNLTEKQKIKEVVLHILNETQGLDYYKIFKVLYFAEREHLGKYGRRIIADQFCALPYGPVPTNLYDAVKDKVISELLADVVKFAGEDASNVLLPKRPCNLEYLSASDIACINNSIKENARLSFFQLKEKSHDLAWENAGHCKVMSSVDMARAFGASEDMLEYIREQENLDRILV